MIKEKKIITLKDLECLVDDEILFDKRTICEFFCDELKKHLILGLFLRKSLMDPLTLRIAHVYFTLTLGFAFNAFFYSDDYIEAKVSSSISNNSASKYLYLLKI